jgi:hypothetical protein
MAVTPTMAIAPTVAVAPAMAVTPTMTARVISLYNAGSGRRCGHGGTRRRHRNRYRGAHKRDLDEQLAHSGSARLFGHTIHLLAARFAVRL